MSHRFRYHLIFGLSALAAAAIIFLLLSTTTEWIWFFNWLVGINLVAFILYGIDKGLSKTKAMRVPEAIIHLLALVGGFLGALLGMLVFRHKSNFREHPLFLPVIVISAILWGFLAYWFIWR